MRNIVVMVQRLSRRGSVSLERRTAMYVCRSSPPAAVGPAWLSPRSAPARRPPHRSHRSLAARIQIPQLLTLIRAPHRTVHVMKLHHDRALAGGRVVSRTPLCFPRWADALSSSHPARAGRESRPRSTVTRSASVRVRRPLLFGRHHAPPAIGTESRRARRATALSLARLALRFSRNSAPPAARRPHHLARNRDRPSPARDRDRRAS